MQPSRYQDKFHFDLADTCKLLQAQVVLAKRYILISDLVMEQMACDTRVTCGLYAMTMCER